MTPEEFWKAAEQSEKEVQKWPAWKRRGVDVGLAIKESMPDLDYSELELRGLQELQMNCYLILWHKPTGTLVHFENLGENRDKAHERHRRLEHLLWNGQLEIVVLHAESEEALKRTHGKYWL